jgi:TonB family protein
MIPALTLTNLAAYSLQVAAVVAVGGAALFALRVQSPTVRLACLRGVLAACLLLPFIAATPPAIRAQPVAPRQADAAASLQTTVTGRAATAPSARFGIDAIVPAASRLQAAWPSVAFLVPICLVGGAVARLLWLGIGLVSLGRLRRRARLLVRVDCRQPALVSTDGPVPAIAGAGELVGTRADFLISAAVTRPVTFGLRHPVVLLPDTFRSLDRVEQEAIATHELLHVRRRDWLQTIGEELLRAVFWFHPAVWWLLGQIDLGREQVVDQAVVALTERRQPYVNALVRLALVASGPVLRPASLFLGRAHLVKRVALLSREVRMSRWRLAVSAVLVAAAVVIGGHFVVQACPLAGVAPTIARASIGDLTLPAPSPAASSVVEPPPGAPAHVRSAGAAATVAQETPRQVPPSTLAPRVIQSFPPNLAPGNVESGKDAVVTIAATVGMSGTIDGPVSIWADNGKAQASGSASSNMDRVFDTSMAAAAINAQMRAALDALRLWRFEPSPTPANVYVGFNFAADQSASFEPVRVGGGVKQPVRVKDVRPVYPEEAQNRGVQGVVILELLIDGNTGIPAQAVALRPVSMLTIPALQAGLQWRFAPTPEIPRLQMTVTINFTLDGGVAGGVAGGVRGGVARGVEGGVAGGVAGGVSGGVTGSTQLSIPAGWPAPIRVGGNIKQPTKILDVRPVYPPAAQNARVQGVVIVEVLIGPDGKVADAKILRSIPLLDQAALDAVRQWQFTPTLLNGTPVPVIMTCTVNFTLEAP